MIDKIKKTIEHPYAQQFRDIRFVGFCVFGVLVLLVSWSGVGVIQTNYKLQKQISKLDQQNEVLALENTNLDLRNQYFKTDQYLELQARRQFGKAAPGEKLILVPKKVALAYTVNLPADDLEKPDTVAVKKPLYQRNFEAWMSFLFHRSVSQ